MRLWEPVGCNELMTTARVSEIFTRISQDKVCKDALFCSSSWANTTTTVRVLLSVWPSEWCLCTEIKVRKISPRRKILKNRKVTRCCGCVNFALYSLLFFFLKRKRSEDKDDESGTMMIFILFVL